MWEDAMPLASPPYAGMSLPPVRKRTVFVCDGVTYVTRPVLRVIHIRCYICNTDAVTSVTLFGWIVS